MASIRCAIYPSSRNCRVDLPCIPADRRLPVQKVGLEDLQINSEILSIRGGRLRKYFERGRREYSEGRQNGDFLAGMSSFSPALFFDLRIGQSETLKYLYLLFEDESVIPLDGKAFRWSTFE